MELSKFVEMGDSKILLNNVPDFGGGFILVYFYVLSFPNRGCLCYYFIGYVHTEKIFAFSSKYLLSVYTF